MMFLKKHKVFSLLCILILISIIGMVFTDTLSYPYILADRQIELISRCVFDSNNFTTDFYGYSFSAPKGYCVLPDRLFPVDGSIEIVPRGWYFVFNEYAEGTIAEGAKATLLFEPMTTERNPDSIIHSLISGKFLDATNIGSTINSSGVGFTLANNVLGADNRPYDWAFATRPDKKYFLAIVTKSLDNQEVGQYILKDLKLN